MRQKSRKYGRLQGAPEGIRTPNLLIRSQVLYPLSYGRPCGARVYRPSSLPNSVVN
jgi:hypothetical protein